MVSTKLFRQEALQKLSSPEQLDEAITITDTKGWMALIAFGLIVCFLIRWLIVGTIPVTISGHGIFFKEGGIHKAVALINGTVTDLNIKINDEVKEGQVIGKMSAPEILDMDIEIDGLKEEIYNLEGNKEGNEALIKELSRKLGIINRKKILYSEIKSPVNGKVLDVNVNNGDMIKEHDIIAIIEPPYGNMEALIYIPVSQGQKIEPGMEVEISPQIVKKDLYGFILGKIKSVDNLPETPTNMMKDIANEDLVKMFSQEGPVRQVYIELLKESNNKSGYKWSAGKGPDFEINSGTLCSCVITLKTFHPYSLILPFTKD